MHRSKWLFWLAFLSLACLSALPSRGFSEDARVTIYESELTELFSISARLSSLNQTLAQEVSNLSTNYAVLSNRLATSAAGLTGLQYELESWKASFAVLSERLTLSVERSVELTASLAKAERSLADSQASFAAYTNAVSSQISALELQRNLAVAGGILGLIAGVVLAIIF